MLPPFIETLLGDLVPATVLLGGAYATIGRYLRAMSIRLTVINGELGEIRDTLKALTSCPHCTPK